MSMALAAPVLIDVIRYWAGHANRYGRTYGHLTAFNIKIFFVLQMNVI